MRRTIVLAVLGAMALTHGAPVHAAPPGAIPSAVELAATTAACMTYNRHYPDGQGVAAYGTIYQAALIEDEEPFAVVSRALGTRGNYALDALPIPNPLHGEGWARERDRYASSCFNDALTMAGF